MKKLLFILFSSLVLVNPVNAQSAFGEIILTQKVGDREIVGGSSDTSPETAPKTRGIIFQPMYAYLCNKVVTVDFQVSFSSVTINIINGTTEKTVYSEMFINPTCISIDLRGENDGEYKIEVISGEDSFEGFFPI